MIVSVELQKCKEKKKLSCHSFLGITYFGKINEFTHGKRNVHRGGGNEVIVILCSGVSLHFSLSLQFMRGDVSGILLT